MDVRLVAAALTLLATSSLLAALLSVAIGSLTTGIAATGLLLGVVAAVLALRSSRGPDAAAPPSWLDRVAWLVLAIAALRQFLWLAFERDGMLLTWNAFNYGDLPLHWTYIRFFANGAPFWPENPIFTGERLRYPLGMDLFNAMLLESGVPLRLGLSVTGLLASALLGATLRRWGGGLAVLALVFSGGIASDDLAWKNLFLALVVPQRGFLFALPAGLLLLVAWRDRLLRGRGAPIPAWVEGLLLGAMPLFHLHTFLALSLVLALWSCAARRIREALPALAWAVLPGTWGVLMVTDFFGAASLVGWAPGWVIGGAPVLPFLAKNFGLLIPLGVWLLVRAPGKKEQLLAVVPAVTLWTLLFFVKLAPWPWDNTKVMIWCYLLLVPALAEALLTLRPLARLALVAAWLAPGAITMAGATFGTHGYEVLVVAETEAVCAALEALPLTGRVATQQAFNHPVALCGHPLVAGYGGHLWSHGIAARTVEARLGALMMGAPGWEEAARALHARYLFWGRREAAAFPGSARPWEAERPLLAEGAWGGIYDLGD